MKIGIFADPHIGPDEITCGTRHPSLSPEKMKRAVAQMKKEGTELIVCLGDLSDGSEPSAVRRDLDTASQILFDSGVRFYCLPGNHDFYCLSEKEWYDATEFYRLPFSEDIGKLTLVFLDACYTDNGTPDGIRYFSDGQKPDWKNSFIPRPQLNTLKFTLMLAPPDQRFVIFCHQSLDPDCEPRHVVRNAAEVRAIIDEFGRGRVKKVICGHYHKGGLGVHGGVEYVGIPALCEGTDIPDGAVRVLEL